MVRCFPNDVIAAMLVESTQFKAKIPLFASKPQVNLLIKDEVEQNG
jgi:hypothetical protein